MVTKQFNILGLMSGTSLDGLDLAHVSFDKLNDKWIYKVNAAQTIAYELDLKAKLQNAFELSGLALSQLNVDLGKCFGKHAKKFLESIALPTHFIASHGHTIFHQPENRLSLQIGAPAAISANCKLPVVADFRTKDVALGGNGAPLVPIGDVMLFGQYDVCINLGGIANLSFDEFGHRKAFDVCPFNMVFNQLVAPLNLPFDRDGALTSSGKCDKILLNTLNELPFYQLIGPKSLGKEWVDDLVLPILYNSDLSIPDKLNTFAHHTVQQMSKVIPRQASRVLLTGGGAFHHYFVTELQKACPQQHIEVPDDLTVQYKEAIIFAFLGLLRWNGEVNCLSSVTGASEDNIGGAVYL